MAACSGPAPTIAPAAGVKATPVYSTETGKLEQIVSDRDGDGTIDARAFMDGVRLLRIEIDRNGDGKPDRWEHYRPGSDTRAASQPEIERAEEANGPGDRITRHELYENGALRRVEEDTDADGRIDKWEQYESGQLVRVDLDLTGSGTPDRRMHYRRDGTVARVEVDSDGSGQWRPFVPPA